MRLQSNEMKEPNGTAPVDQTAPHEYCDALAAQQRATASLNAKFERLAFDLHDGDDGDFLSGWQCQNPFVSRFLSNVRQRAETLDHRRYSYFDAHSELGQSILDHHTCLDGVRPEAVLCGCGTTSLLFTWATYLHSIGVSRVYYLPPLYITLHTALDRYGIRTIPLTARQPYEPSYDFELPDEPGATLLLTDPVWYAGVTIPPHFISRVAEWQRRVSATVFVDGTLQYLPWGDKRGEGTAALDSELTFRLVCPSKQLCVHGYRFSYMLLPSAHFRGLAWTYTNLFGPAPADSIAFAYEAMAALREATIPNQLMTLVSRRYRHLLGINAIASDLSPTCGYFVFVQVRAPLPVGYVLLDGAYFDQHEYAGYTKLNLLSPSLHLIGGDTLPTPGSEACPNA
jgi:aspartate/methionine/tyrosine aminotransferase